MCYILLWCSCNRLTFCKMMVKATVASLDIWLYLGLCCVAVCEMCWAVLGDLWALCKSVSKYLYFGSTVVCFLSCAMSELSPPSEMFSGKEWLPLLGEVSCWLVLSVKYSDQTYSEFWLFVALHTERSSLNLSLGLYTGSTLFFFCLLLKTPSPFPFSLAYKKNKPLTNFVFTWNTVLLKCKKYLIFSTFYMSWLTEN